jgi:hypothetical protein
MKNTGADVRYGSLDPRAGKSQWARSRPRRRTLAWRLPSVGAVLARKEIDMGASRVQATFLAVFVVILFAGTAPAQSVSPSGDPGGTGRPGTSGGPNYRASTPPLITPTPTPIIPAPPPTTLGPAHRSFGQAAMMALAVIAASAIIIWAIAELTRRGGRGKGIPTHW